MRASRPPFIASWILDRFGPRPETEAIAGDLFEQYQQGRSRLWYWREAIVAILTGTWSEVKQHSLLLLGAIAMAWILGFVWEWVVTPWEYSLIVRYVLGRHARPEEIPLVGFLIEAPLALAMGWTVARFARRCRIPAVFGIAFSGLLSGAWSTWKNAQSAESFGYHFSVWTFSWPIPLMTVLVLLGGGLLTGLPKRSIRPQ
jgi:hypothetical protein